MTALRHPVFIPTKHRQRAAVTAALGLSVGAVGWCGIANATGEEKASQVLLLPEHYELMDNGVVVFKLETGEDLSLTSDQYLILDGGLLLIVDELAQASISSHSVMGSVRAQLLSDLEQIATIDGTVAEATQAQTRLIKQGKAARLSEQIDLPSYAIDQRFDCNNDSDDKNCIVALGSGNQADTLNLSVAPAFVALLGLLMAKEELEVAPESDGHQAGPRPEYWTDAMVANSASTAIIGSSADSFVGYTAASTSAAIDPLSKVGNFSVASFDMSAGGNNFFVAGDSAATAGLLTYTGGPDPDNLTFESYLAYDGRATFDMSLGGNNTFVAGEHAAKSGGEIAYTGGRGEDNLTFGDYLSQRHGAAVNFDMALGGNNTFVAGDDAAYRGGKITYTGGPDEDNLTFEDRIAGEGEATFDMSRGGNNTFVADDNAASSSGSIAYTGGSGDDSLIFDDYLADDGGTATFDMSRGGNNTFVADDNAASSSGSIAYTGGSGDDSLTFGDDIAYDEGVADFDMSLGGNNTFVAGNDAAYSDGEFTYIGGPGDDNLTFEYELAEEGEATFDMSLGGNNRLMAGSDAASSGSLEYIGGSANDNLTFGDFLAYEGEASFNMVLGGNNTLVADDRAAASGSLKYIGGPGNDSLTFGDNAAWNAAFSVDLGADSATDTITFEGYVGNVHALTAGVQIQNFNVFDDLLTVARSFSVLTDSSPQGTITGIEMADQYGTINFTGLTGVSYTDFVAAITIS